MGLRGSISGDLARGPGLFLEGETPAGHLGLRGVFAVSKL